MCSIARSGADSPLNVLEGGTDAGSMLIFDPAALPDDYDSGSRFDPLSAIEPLASDGKLYWLDTAADGAYTLGVWEGARLPERWSGFAVRLGDARRFAALSGRLYFAGIEYAFRRDDSHLRKYPHMGSCQAIRPGIYHVEVYDMNYPDGFHEIHFRKSVSAREFYLYSMMNSGLIPLGYVSALALVASPLWLGLRGLGVTAPMLCLALVLLPLALARTRMYRNSRGLYSAIERQYPAYIATLAPHDDQNATRGRLQSGELGLE